MYTCGHTAQESGVCIKNTGTHQSCVAAREFVKLEPSGHLSTERSLHLFAVSQSHDKLWFDCSAPFSSSSVHRRPRYHHSPLVTCDVSQPIRTHRARPRVGPSPEVSLLLTGSTSLLCPPAQRNQEVTVHSEEEQKSVKFYTLRSTVFRSKPSSAGRKCAVRNLSSCFRCCTFQQRLTHTRLQ